MQCTVHHCGMNATRASRWISRRTCGLTTPKAVAKAQGNRVKLAIIPSAGAFTLRQPMEGSAHQFLISVLLQRSPRQVFLISVPLRRSLRQVFLISVPLQRSPRQVFLISVPLQRSLRQVFLVSVPLQRSPRQVFLISVPLRRSPRQVFLISVPQWRSLELIEHRAVCLSQATQERANFVVRRLRDRGVAKAVIRVRRCIKESTIDLRAKHAASV